MPSNNSKRRLCDLGIFVLPVALVKIAGSLLGTGGPADASAAPAPAAVDLAQQAALAATSLTSEQLALGEYISQLEQEPFGDVPMYYEPAEEIPEILLTEDPIMIAVPPPSMTIQAIMSSSNGTTALINGRVYRVGDEVDESGWTIVEIDGDARSLIIQEIGTDRRETVTSGSQPGFPK